MSVALARTGWHQATFAFVCVAAGCSRSGPTTDDLTDAVRQTVAGVTISDVRCETFADKTEEGVGRGSCKGTLSLNQDQYAPLAPRQVQDLLIEAGIPRTGAGFFLQRHPRPVFTQVVARGAETSFSSECTYRRVVDAWNVGCSTSYQPFPGEPLAGIGGLPVVKDSPGYQAWIGETTTDFRQLDAAYRVAEGKVKSFFAPGRTIILQLNTGQPWYRAKVTTDLAWQGEPGILGHQGFFSTLVKYVDLRERTNQTLCGYARGQPMDDLLVSGGISPTLNNPGAIFTPNVQVMERNALFNNGFMGCGNTLNWNGTSFGSSLNNALELVSK